MFRGYIYIIENSINDHKYIGQTRRTILQRWKCHLYESYRDRALDTTLYKAFNKYGIENFSIRILHEVESSTLDDLIQALNTLEIEFIEKYGTYKNGYNMTAGGYTSEHTNKEVAQYSLDGKFIRKYESMVSAERYGFSYSSISGCCNGRNLSHGGFMWRFANGDYTKDISPYKKVSKKPKINIAVYNMGGDLVGTCSSLLEVRQNYTPRLTTSLLYQGTRVDDYRFLVYDKEPLQKYEFKPKIPRGAVVVLLVDNDDRVLEEFSSIEEASKVMFISRSSIKKSINCNMPIKGLKFKLK